MPECCTRFPAPTRAWTARGLLLLLVTLSPSLPAHAWGGKVILARRYRPGQRMVYQTNTVTHATIRSTPEGLKSFLPPIPTEFSTRQQNTVTVRAVQSEGTADVETRIDAFDFTSDVFARIPESAGASAEQAGREFSRRVSGQTLTAHYDHNGRLLRFEGGDDLIEQLDASLREPFRQILKFFLEQMGGDALYPDHPVKRGDEWTRKLSARPSAQYPFSMEGENVLHFVGKSKYHGVKAAIVEYRFTNVLKPELANLPQFGPLTQLLASGVELDLGIEGRGQGRVLLALDDGRILQNRSTLHQTLKTSLKPPPQNSSARSEPLTLEINSDTTLELDGSGK